MSKRSLAIAAAGGTGDTKDPNFKNVSLLLNGDGTNGAQNNTFLDSSTNNFTITRNGNATQGTFSPYGNLWSNYLPGGTARISAAAGSSYLGTGNFTIEFWCFAPNALASDAIVLAHGYNGSSFTGGFYISSNATSLYFGIGNAAAGSAVTNSASMPIGSWFHYAVTRTSGTVNIWQNGVLSGTGSQSGSGTNTGTALTIGNIPAGSLPANVYISNLRIVVGTALYTSNFTPSTTPLTAVSGTSLLTCQSNRFKDNSSNNFTLTVNGNTSVQRFSPFNPTAPYSAATIGGSGYFDGSGDYLSVASNANLPEGNESYTIEAWIYLNAATGGMGIAGWGSSSTNLANVLRINDSGDGLKHYWWANDMTTGDIGIRPFQWHHVVAQFDGTTRKVFLDGVLKQSDTPTGHNVTVTNNLQIGNQTSLGAGAFNGYISDVRIATTALYSGSSYTVPTSPLSNVAYTQFLCNFINAGIPDAAMMNDLETVGNAQVSTSVKKYGTGSLYFDGTGDYLVIPQNDQTAITADGTIEAWIYLTSYNTTDSYAVSTIFCNSNGGSAGSVMWTSFGVYGNYLQGALSLSSRSYDVSSAAGAIPLNQWVHVAAVKSGSTVTLYKNGSSIGSGTFNEPLFANTAGWSLRVGHWYYADGPNRYFNGYIDDLRITKGLARYTANFTPPAQSLPKQ